MHELLGCSYLWGCFVYRKEYKTKDSRSTLWLDLRQIKGKVIHSSQFGNYEKKNLKKTTSLDPQGYQIYVFW